MNNHVRFKKKSKPIPETETSNRQNRYKLKRVTTLFVNIARRINKINVSTFIRGSNDCINNLPAAYSWLNKEFFSKSDAEIRERWIKPLLII